MIFDADLSGADAQVVAWEAEDEDLKAAFRGGMNVHIKNAEDLFGAEWHAADGGAKVPGTKKFKIYNEMKQGVHATNYGASARTIAITLGWTVAKAQEFQLKWFTLHPQIKANFHEKIKSDLFRPTHCVWNKFGYRRIYFDRVDEIFPEALAWVPQSTIAINCRRSMRQLKRHFPEVEMLIQVHDSVIFQLPFRLCDKLDRIREGLSLQIPYSDPLTIQWKIARSEKSWGDCEEIKG